MTPENLDLVYILGTGSHWQNNEIRYSLRSVEKYLPHGKVFIVGYKPRWAKNVVHIDCPDPYRNKLQNSIYKTIKAAKDPRIGERFVLMNDDFFFLRPVERLKVCYRDTLHGSIKGHQTKNGYYFEAMRRTMAMLKEAGIKEPKDYAVHYPMTLEKKKIRKLAARFDHKKDGYLFRTVYANFYGLGGYPRTDAKAKHVSDLKLRKFRGIDLLSTNDGIVLQKSFQEWIDKRFPEPSRYEIEGIEDDVHPPMMVKRYHTPRKFTYGSRSYGKGEIVEGPIPAKIVKSMGLIPIWEKPETLESGGER